MVTPVLGRLEQVDLRTAWVSEAGGFTPWLAQEGNLALLGETIGLDLELEAQERDVGPFRADILCKDTATNHWVLIENQLERTDHTHLGQLLTYAAGLDAVTIVWIAAHFTDEHRAALDWLNEKTEDSVDFFGLEIELWRIGDSPPAPKFNVVSKPNNWSATVAGGARRIETTELTPTKELQYEYWEAFRQELLQHSRLRPPPARPTHEMDIALGRAGVVLRARLTSRENWVQTAIVIMDRQRDGFWFACLESQMDKIDKELGFSLTWNSAANPRENRIYVRLQNTDFRDRSDWQRQHTWLREKLEILQRVFVRRVKALPTGEGFAASVDGNSSALEAEPQALASANLGNEC